MTLQVNLDESDSVLRRTLDVLGWSPFDSKAPELGSCSFNPNHWVPKSGLVKHHQYCSLRHQGYQKAEIEAMIPQPESVASCLTNQSCFDWTNDPQWNTNLQAFEVNKRNRMRLMQVNLANSTESAHSKYEALALMRDLKRRRQSYRGIHTAKKSYTEVLRELIAQQTESLMLSSQSRSNPEDHPTGPDLSREPSRSRSDHRLHHPQGHSDHSTNRHKDRTKRTESDPTVPHSSPTTGCRKSRHQDRSNSSSPESKHSKKTKKHKHKHHKHHKHK